MKVLLTRDSVAMGDDTDAPHHHTADLPADLPLRAAVAAITGGGYLARIAGGRATWVLATGGGTPIAVTAQQWGEPRLLVPGEPALAACAAATRAADGETLDGDVVRWHFRYLAQEDPDAVHDRLRAART
ncbi:hypothetical protein ABZ721_29280 [Streptomyces sp. NPDC006733]|uniref:hypothetical protein n=1 Tax=Streptomyces sp. NPDC006733 TaxID=3155460 RepID=UPI0033E0B9BB